MASIKIEVEFSEAEIEVMSIGKKMAEDDTQMKLSFRQFFSLAIMNYISNRPKNSIVSNKANTKTISFL